MSAPYVEARHHGLLFVAGTRVPLAVVVHAFREGESPEAIRQSFPALTLEQVYGTIAYCLARPGEVDTYIARLTRVEDQAERLAPPIPASLQRKLRAARPKAQNLRAAVSRHSD